VASDISSYKSYKRVKV